MAASQSRVPGAGAVHACPRPLMVKEPFSTHYTDLTEHWPTPDQLPVVYHDRYNVHFFGLEKLHPFDACKFRKVVQALTAKGVIAGREQLVTPLAASREVLSDVHSAQYLEEIHTSTLRVVQVTELAPLTLLPNALLQWRVVTPMRIHVGGTMLAAGLALERGWAVNIGGGMHHAYHSAGGGWCPFDDVMLAVRRLRKATGGALKRVLYVDLDAHQGNGVARDKLHFNDTDFIILDVYTDGIYPNDLDAKAGIDIAVPLKRGTGDVAYLSALRSALDRATREYPDIDLVFYNAGTDILDGDPLGRLGVSAAGVIERDEVVWRWAMDTLQVPVVMTLSGGYSTRSAQVIADSLENLFAKFNLAAGLPQ